MSTLVEQTKYCLNTIRGSFPDPEKQLAAVRGASIFYRTIIAHHGGYVDMTVFVLAQEELEERIRKAV